MKYAIANDYVQNRDADTVHPYDRDTYQKFMIARTSDLTDETAVATEKLVAPLLRALSIDARYLPYAVTNGGTKPG